MTAARQFQSAFTRLAEELQYKTPQWQERVELTTRFGKICFGTSGNDFYTGRYGAIIDTGGNDNYDIELRADFVSPDYWLIDVGGDDVYRKH